MELDTKLSIFEIGSKIVNLLASYCGGGKIGLSGELGTGKAVLTNFFLKHGISLQG